MARITLLPMRDVAPQQWDFVQRPLADDVRSIRVVIDRTELNPADTGTIVEMGLVMSPDGAAWPQDPDAAGEWIDRSATPAISYPLAVRAGIPGGALTGPRGQVVTESSLGIKVPPTLNNRARLYYRVLQSSRFAVVVETLTG